MGISIVLYKADKADTIDDLDNLENQMDKSKSVNLYKATEDLGIIFMNTANPYTNTEALPYKILFGNYVEKEIDYRIINGFIPTTEVAIICDWIKKHNIDSYEGFEKMFDNLTNEAKQALEDIGIGGDDKKGLFNAYVEPLTQFYFSALKEKNSILLCGE